MTSLKFNIIIDMSRILQGLDMNQSLYFSKWYRFNKKNRMILLQFLIETRNPLRVGSLGLVGCNMEQFSQVGSYKQQWACIQVQFHQTLHSDN